MFIYQNIAKQLKMNIDENLYKNGFLPSETDLANHFKINRNTLRKALNELVKAGLIEKKQGKATLIIDKNNTYLLSGCSHYTKNFKKSGIYPRTKVLFCKKISPSLNVSSYFEQNYKYLIHIKTLRIIHNEPRSLIDHYLPFTDRYEEIKHFKTGSLHYFLQNHLGIKLTRKKTTISALMPSAIDKQHLNLKSNIPVTLVKTENKINNEEGFLGEISFSRTRSDLVQITVEH
ncbi:hypothetical protein CF386_06800 [Paraphotobacterium marinum]|uniref:HTH gntR-type domain-containing protein n=1 Tax=Paraphotobacterium marinum TaxID=1755811 RepID=A0A220VE99_9GAMM|nr:UTRA domain-containing protein [Paraphotobacterium marinum]ASK78724.1 hypothetical protein CF386_06800 [Paraphotobacterium marinum]